MRKILGLFVSVRLAALWGQSGFLASQNVFSLDYVDLNTGHLNRGTWISEPSGGAISANGATIYLLPYLKNGIQSIDTASNQRSAMLAPGRSFGRLAATPDGKTVYASNTPGTIGATDNGIVYSIDAQSGVTETTSRVVSYQGGIDDLKVAADGTKLFVLAVDHGVKALYAFDTTSLTLISKIPVNGSLSSFVLSPEASRAYLGGVSGTTYVADLTLGRVTAEVSIGGAMLSITPSGDRVYTFQDIYTTVLTSFDTATLQVITLATLPYRGQLAVAPDGASLYVVAPYQIYQVDAATGVILRTIPVSLSDTLWVGIDSASKRLYLTSNTSPWVSKFDVSTNRLSGALEAGSSIKAMLVPKGSNRLYTLEGTGLVSLSSYNLTTKALLSRTTDERLRGSPPILQSPDGRRLYVSATGGGIAVVDSSTGQISGVIPPGEVPTGGTAGMAISRDGRYIYAILDTPASGIAVFDTVTQAYFRSILTPWFPNGGMATNPHADVLYVAAYGAILVYNTVTQERIGTLTADPFSAMTVSPDGSQLWLHSITAINQVIDARTGVMLGTIPTPSPIPGFSPDGTAAYTQSRSEVQVYSTTTFQLTGTIPSDGYVIAFSNR